MTVTEMFGGICEVPAASSAGTVEILLETGTLQKLLAFWENLARDARPRLRGLTVSNAKDKMHILVSPPASGPTVLITVNVRPDKPMPHLHDIWPYACWWESELRSFENIQIKERQDRRENGGVAWRLS